MNDSKNINHFQELLKLRSLFKSVSQLSWNIAQIEKRYPIDSLSEQEVKQLLSAYENFSGELKKIDDELEKELENGNKKT